MQQNTHFVAPSGPEMDGYYCLLTTLRKDNFAVHYSEVNSVEDQFIPSKAFKAKRATRNEL